MSEHNNTSKVRTRIAPSPTGYPHIGTIYQALFDYGFAKKNGGKFVVRIEDTDRKRFVADAEEKLFAALDWFGLQEDESPRKGGTYSPYRQSERLEMYRKYAQELLDKGHAYYCFCTAERLDEMRKQQQAEKKPVMYDKHCRSLITDEAMKRVSANEPHVVRMKIPESTTLTYRDEIRGEISVESNTVDDQVIIKSDGFPTYHLAVVVDDHCMNITHVLRGPEWLSSTPKHFLLYEYFGWDKPLFFHTPLLSNPDHSKLSKRHGHTNVNWYKEEGYLPEAILNFLALLGWSHPEEKEIFSLDEFIQHVELQDLKPVSPVFDVTKLTWMNQQYIQHMEDEQLSEKLLDFYSDKKLDGDVVRRLLPLVKTRMETLKDFYPLTEHFYEQKIFSPRQEQEKTIAAFLSERLDSLPEWNSEAILAVLKLTLKEYNIRMPVLYYIFTGKEKGLPLPESLEMIGKEKVVEHLRQFMK